MMQRVDGVACRGTPPSVSRLGPNGLNIEKETTHDARRWREGAAAPRDAVQYRIRKAPEQQRSDHGPPELRREVEEREGPVSYDGYRRLEGAWEYFLSSIS